MLCVSGYAQKWYPRKSLPSAGRYAAPAFSIGDLGYIIGGESATGILKDFWSYNSKTNTWNQKPPFPGSPRVKPIAFQINGIGYYGLGSDSTFFKYDPELNKWTQLKSPGLGISYWSASYFVEGTDAFFLFASSQIFAKYNTITDTWIQLENFPGSLRFTGNGFSANGKGYITCGVASFGMPYLNDLWEYDIAKNKWEQKNSLPATGRYAATSFSLNGFGFLLGGERFSPNTTLNEFWKYDPLKDSWSRLPDFPGGFRNYLTGFIINDNIYAGFGSFGYNNDLFMFGNLCDNPTIISPDSIRASINTDVGFTANSAAINANYQWQTNPANIGWSNLNNNVNYKGTTTNTLSISNLQIYNHNQLFRVVVNYDNCTDTSSVTRIIISDTCITSIVDTNYVILNDTNFIKITDTLLINTMVTGLNTTGFWNSIKIFPNPANTHITIDFGNLSSISGYKLKILNSFGAIVFTTSINQQISYVDLSTWSGKGIYFVQLIDPQNRVIENRKILLQ